MIEHVAARARRLDRDAEVVLHRRPGRRTRRGRSGGARRRSRLLLVASAATTGSTRSSVLMRANLRSASRMSVGERARAAVLGVGDGALRLVLLVAQVDERRHRLGWSSPPGSRRRRGRRRGSAAARATFSRSWRMMSSAFFLPMPGTAHQALRVAVGDRARAGRGAACPERTSSATRGPIVVTWQQQVEERALGGGRGSRRAEARPRARACGRRGRPSHPRVGQPGERLQRHGHLVADAADVDDDLSGALLARVPRSARDHAIVRSRQRLRAASGRRAKPRGRRWQSAIASASAASPAS